MNARRGSAGAIVILAIGVALAAAGALSAEMTLRRHAYQEHLLHVQGREYALGACRLAPGTQCAVNGWTIAVAADGAVSAATAGGTYRIAVGGGERWTTGARP